MIRLAIVRQRYTPFGGAERLIEEGLNFFAQKNAAALSIYARKWQGEPQNCTVIKCNPFYIGSLWRDVSFLKSVESRLKKDAPDLIQSHERIAECDVYRTDDGVHRAWLAARLKHAHWGQKLSIYANPAHHFRLYAEKRMFLSPRLKAVICISQMVKNDVLRYFPQIENKLHVIYNGVDSNRFSPHLKSHRAEVLNAFNIPLNARVFLFVGSGFWRKGLKTAILALPQKDHLIVVGKDKHLKRYQRLAQGKNVHFAGAQKNPDPFYGAADAFVLPSLYDPLSLSVLEALACGLPVFTTHTCGAGEIVEEFKAGALFEANDTTHLNALMQNPDFFTASLSQNARQAALSLTPEAMQEKTLQLYHQLIKQ